ARRRPGGPTGGDGHDPGGGAGTGAAPPGGVGNGGGRAGGVTPRERRPGSEGRLPEPTPGPGTEDPVPRAPPPPMRDAGPWNSPRNSPLIWFVLTVCSRGPAERTAKILNRGRDDGAEWWEKARGCCTMAPARNGSQARE